jgi:hypothetical protein
MCANMPVLKKCSASFVSINVKLEIVHSVDNSKLTHDDLNFEDIIILLIHIVSEPW